MIQPKAPTSPVRDVVVLGAGPTGLTTAMLLARAGFAVLVLERDPGPVPSTAAQAWEGWSRPGVNQFRQVHIPLARWHREMAAELPEVVAALVELGGREVNLLHLNPPAATGGWRPGDERYITVAARRPVLEGALTMVAAAEPGMTIRRGCRMTGLVTRWNPDGRVRVTGVRLEHELITADLVIDASGRRTSVAGWLAALGVAPQIEEAPSALTYYSRYYQSPGGSPLGVGPALVHHESYSLLMLPADNDIWTVTIVVGAADRPPRALLQVPIWEAAVRACGVPDAWLSGTAISQIRAFGGLRDIVRDYAPGGHPVVSGLLSVGDAWATTNPFLGRGLSLGAIQAAVLRDAVSDGADTGADAVTARYAAQLHERAEPYVRATIDHSRHRVAQMAAEAAGRSYRTDDPGWAASTALAAGSRSDPVLLRAYQEIANTLAIPAEVFADPELRSRLGPWFGASPYPPDHPGRSDLLGAIEARGHPVLVTAPPG